MIDERLIECNGEPECNENFNRVLAIVDETTGKVDAIKLPNCEEETAGSYQLVATVDAEGAVTYAWTLIPEE